MRIAPHAILCLAILVSPATLAAQTFNGLEGDDKSLVLHISRPPRFGAYVPATNGVRSVSSQGSDRISVTYLMAGSSSPLHEAVQTRVGKTHALGAGQRAHAQVQIELRP